MMQEMTLTRESIEAYHHGEAPAKGQWPDQRTESEIEASLDAAIAEVGQDGLWLFAYGSLLWNREFPHTEQRIAKIHGYHRRFCLWQWRWRGCDETPNLMLALAPGGSCTGVAYRIEGPDLREKIGPVWRRELSGGGYWPLWIKAKTESGTLRVAAFIANRAGERYSGPLPDDVVATTIAKARGHGGTGAEYLLNTTLAMEELGVRDHMLWRMQHLVGGKLK